ncbi:hypothetical protein ZIOFF_071333 [Zingiber officinale]|uniref:Uncharacterized protein n=1 Tax=Zingiber officinale TaxID=94328 RepID=A0A8J5EQF0_ZINOF|nr:hypothetical protein ZIOFF_071333 [Zingiber officinale]
MEDNPNNDSHQENLNSPFSHLHMVSFQSSAIDSSTGMAPGDVPTLAGNSIMASILMPASFGMPNHIDAATQVQYSTGSVFYKMMPRFRHVSGSPAYWSPDEVETLNRGLINFSSEERIQKYTKIAAMLPRKTIRDVALRCQWMIQPRSAPVVRPLGSAESWGLFDAFAELPGESGTEDSQSGSASTSLKRME